MDDPINKLIRRVLTLAAGDRTKVFNALVPSRSEAKNLTNIEEWLYTHHQANMTGVHKDFVVGGKTVIHPKRLAYAPCMKLCGRCVGTDKVGHFFEEGYLYQQIVAMKGDIKYAVGLGEWSEGIVPTDAQVLNWLKTASVDIVWSGGSIKGASTYDLFGRFGDAIPGYNGGRSAGKADLAANLGGLRFWDKFFPPGGTGGGVTTSPASAPDDFDICDYVTDAWDENLNPNVKPDVKPVP